MLIIIEGPHNTGKSGVAQRISDSFHIPIWPSLTRNGDIKVDRKSDEFSVTTSAINATLGKALLHYPDMNFIMDRFHISAKVYSEFYKRKKTNFDFIDNRFKEDAILIQLSASAHSMMKRGPDKKRNKKYSFDDCCTLHELFKGAFQLSNIKRKIYLNTTRFIEKEIQDDTVKFVKECLDANRNK